MSDRANLLRIDLPWADRDLDDLLAALRRHDAADAARLLREIQPDPDSIQCEDVRDWFKFSAAFDLHTWTRAEALQHVEQGRPEYALALVERYRREFDADDMRARNPQQPRPLP